MTRRSSRATPVAVSGIAGLLFAIGQTAKAEEPANDPAQDSLFGAEEIVVTATIGADHTKFDSSVAISTFDAEDIAQQSPISAGDLISAVPGFWVESTSGSTQGNVFARGIVQPGGYRYVAVEEDGIPIFPVYELGFYNPEQFTQVDDTIARVEALRGGSAPIFATGAIGGSVNFISRSPTETAQGSVKLSTSDFGMQRAEGWWSGPLSDNWGLMVGGFYGRSDTVRDPGYTGDQGGQLKFKLVRNLQRGSLELFGKYLNNKSLFVVPIPLENPSDPHGVNGTDAGTYALQSVDLARAPLPPSAANVGIANSSLEDGVHPELTTLGAKWELELSDSVSLTQLFRYTDADVRFDAIFPGDAPFTGTEFAASRGVAPNYTVISTGASYPATGLVQNHGHWAVNKEFNALQYDGRANFTFGAHNASVGLYWNDMSVADRWTLGNLLLQDVSDRPNRLSLPGVTDPNGFTQYSFFNLLADYDATTYALYASDEWQISDALRLDAGLRYDHQKIDASIHDPSAVNLDGNPATPWDNQASMAPAAANRTIDKTSSFTGFSAGLNYEFTKGQAVFARYTQSAKLPHFDNLREGLVRNEELDNIDLGYKVSVDRLALFATLFQTKFSPVFNDIDSNGVAQLRAAETKTTGIELEGEAQPLPALSIRFNLTYQDSEYESFTGLAGGVFDFAGNRIRRIPKFMGRIAPSYRFMADRGRVYLAYTRIGDRFANDSNTIELPAYSKLDGGVIFNVTPSLRLQLHGDNLTDEVGLTEANPRTDTTAGGLGNIFMARPLFGRSFVLSASFEF